MPLLQEEVRPENKTGLTPEDKAQQSEDPKQDPEIPEKEGNGFSFAAVEESIINSIDDEKLSQDVDRVVNAGMKLMFGEGSNFQLFEMLDQNKPVGDQMGAAAADLMMIMIGKSGNTMPGEAIVPAGMILLSRAAEFVDEKITEVSEEDFGDASELFIEVINHKIQQGDQGQQPQQPQQPMPQEQPMPQQGGLMQGGA